jgi:hypothetical protein
MFTSSLKGQKKPVRLYINIYERGALLVPVGIIVKKNSSPDSSSILLFVLTRRYSE